MIRKYTEKLIEGQGYFNSFVCTGPFWHRPPDSDDNVNILSNPIENLYKCLFAVI